MFIQVIIINSAYLQVSESRIASTYSLPDTQEQIINRWFVVLK